MRWAIAGIQEPDVVLVKTGPRESTLADLCAELGDEPCYVVFDFEAVREDTSTISKIVFVAYSPDTCTSMKKKFALQNFKASVKAKINCHKEMQINDKADFSEREFRDAFGL